VRLETATSHSISRGKMDAMYSNTLYQHTYITSYIKHRASCYTNAIHEPLPQPAH